ncbi:hypothetical protein ACFE04_008548 [Oxalis oulophora]
MELLDLFVAAFMPVLKVLLLTAVGLFLAIDAINVMGDDARNHLNRITFFVFNPALVGSNLASYITLSSLAKLWFMPVNIFITVMVGSMLGWMLIKIIKVPHDLWGLVLGCCAAGNLGSMPIIIIPAVCKERGSPFGEADVCLAHALAYASLSMAIGAIFLWSYVYNLVRVYSSPVAENYNTRSRMGQLLPLKEVSEIVEQVEIDCARTSTEEPKESSVTEKIKLSFGMAALKHSMKLLFPPSVIGVILGLIVGLVPTLRATLIGDKAPLRVIQGSASLLGEAAIPTVTLIVGANLLKGLKGSEMPPQLIVGIVVVRYIALPMLGVAIIKGAIHFGFIPLDPLYQFVLLLQFALPPAMNIGTITQLFGVAESECSVILLWTYALASVSITLWSTFFLWLVK